MFDLIGTVLTGGATGVIGSVIGKLFGFVDYYVEEKKADKDHGRTIEMLRLQNEIGAEENEREMAVAEANADANMRMASYSHDSMAGTGSVWVANLLRLVRPTLTLGLIVLVGILYFSAEVNGRATIEASVIYMTSSAVLWWFGDRAMRSKK
jgi:hypothetical protein